MCTAQRGQISSARSATQLGAARQGEGGTEKGENRQQPFVLQSSGERWGRKAGKEIFPGNASEKQVPAVTLCSQPWPCSK